MFRVVRPITWESARYLGLRLIRWAFRGQADASWDLADTLHREGERCRCPSSLLANREAWMVRQFQRRAHHYISDPPPYSASLEWLALMQHYGGVTRLLDFTHSFYVAALFACESSSSDSAVWAVNLPALEDAVREKTGSNTNVSTEDIDTLNKRHIDLAESCLPNPSPPRLVLNVEPDRMNERLSLQQGVFLFPCSVEATFLENLAATFDGTPESFVSADEERFAAGKVDVSGFAFGRVMKIILPRGSHKRALMDLQRMNVTHASLFPGLDGFARSLRYHMRTEDQDDDADAFFEMPGAREEEFR